MKKLIYFILLTLVANNVLAQWNNVYTVPEGKSVWAIKFANKNIGYAAGALGTIMKTTDGGNTWNVINTGFKAYLMSIFCIDTNTVFIAGDSILKTVDGGKTWAITSLNYLRSIFFVDKLIGFTVGSDGIVYKTIDGGKTWSRKQIQTVDQLNLVYFVNKDTGYISSTFGIYKTINSGENWTKCNTQSYVAIEKIWFIDSQTGYAVGDNGLIIKTKDGGNSWTKLNSRTNNRLYDILFVSQNTGYAFGNNIILKTENSGESWRIFYNLHCGELYSGCFVDSMNLYAVDGKSIIRTFNAGGMEDTTYIEPKLTLTSNVNYWDCSYAMLSASFSVDSVIPEDSICWVLSDGFGCYYRPNNDKNGGFSQHNISIPNVKAGSYPITLKYKRRNRIVSITKENAYVLRDPPYADFSITNNPDSIYFPATVNFINHSTKGTGDTLYYSWDFGDGSNSTETNPSNIYLKPETYYVQLEVKDNYGCKRTVSNHIVVKDTMQVNEFNFLSGGCFSEAETPPCEGMQLKIENDTLKITGIYYGNCCTKKTAILSSKNDTIFIKTFQTGAECTCGCAFCISITVPNIYKDSIIVSFDNRLYKAKRNIVSINPIFSENKINTYPNPVNDYLLIDCSQIENKIKSIEICDIYGKIMYSQANIIEKAIKLNTEKFASGVFVVRAICENNLVLTRKIIINNAH